MTSLEITNTTTTYNTSEVTSSLLWLPHVILAGVCLMCLAINFWFYHRKHRHRYRHKSEVNEARERMKERRMILNIVKARYAGECDPEDKEYDMTYITCSGIDKPSIHKTSNNVANV